MKWILPSDNHRQALALANELGLHPVAARILISRNFTTPEAADDLLKDQLGDLPDPASLKNIDLAVARLHQALRRGEKITLFGDYDADGVTSVALLTHFLRALGGKVASYVPLRLDEGYGLNIQAVERIAADGTRLLVALDCGTTAHAEVAAARAAGLDVVIVDHHQVASTLPAAQAILNPHQPGCAYPFKELCAAGLTFLLIVAMRRALRESGAFASNVRRAGESAFPVPEPNLREYLDLVALGTIADVVPLLGVNRILVKHGLAELAKGNRTGIRALKMVAGFTASSALSAGQVAFRLAPRLNAAGRLANAAAGIELLTTSDAARAQQLAQELDSANTERQSIEKRILDEAMVQAQGFADGARSLVLASEGWHPGVVGIVAARMVERFHRPTFVVALENGEGRGSGRSIAQFHLYQALHHCAAHLKRFGGHQHAAGLSLATSDLPAFRQALEKHARTVLAPDDLVARCRIDAVIQPKEIDDSLAQAIERLAPFGAGNPEPMLACMRLSAQSRVLAAKQGGAGHLKLALNVAKHLDVIGFGMGEKAALTAAEFDAAFHLVFDEYRGQSKLTMRLKDVRQASQP